MSGNHKWIIPATIRSHPVGLVIGRNLLSLANPGNQESQPYLGELRARPASTACPPVGLPLNGPISCQVQMAFVPCCHTNNSAAYHKALAKKGQAVQAAAATATAGRAPLPSPTRPLPRPPTRSLPPSSTSSPAALAGSGANASDHATVDSATGAQSAEDFCASHR